MASELLGTELEEVYAYRYACPAGQGDHSRRCGPGSSVGPLGSRGALALAYSPDGRWLALTSPLTIKLLPAAATGQPIWEIPSPAVPGEIAFAPDSTTLAVGLSNGTVRLLEVAGGTQTGKLEGHTGAVNGLAFAPDGLTLASAARDGTVRLWRATDGVALRTLEVLQDDGFSDVSVLDLAFAPDGATLAVAAHADTAISFWRVADGQRLRTLDLPGSDWAWRVRFTPDGAALATINSEQLVQLWQANDGAPLHTFAGSAARDFAFTPDGATLAVAATDGSIQLWRVADGTLLHATTERHTLPASGIAVNPDGATIASVSLEGTLRVWGMR